jgi:methionyl-tRNA synthetase
MKKFYITTAIPYVNDVPHIGNAIDFTLADSLARYHKQLGEDVAFEVGTDEHGTKIAQKAEAAGQQPKEFVDSVVPAWKSFLEKLNITPTGFIRTTDPVHERAAQYVWQQLAAKNYIYKGTYEGWYCVGCESFVTPAEAAANNGICPDHKKPYQHLSEENYYFKLSAFTQQIQQALTAGEMKVVPDFRRNEIESLLKEGLKDISISRPTTQLKWGIPVPTDQQHVMYVWFEALLNYISFLGYPDRANFAKYWPSDVWLGGKDILRFHAAIFPAILIGLDLPLVKTLVVHGHVLSGGTKMSKTIGNVVSASDVIDQYGVDAFRYYFLRHVPTVDDGDFTWEKFENAYNNELGNELGNVVQRIVSMVQRYQQGVIGDLPTAQHDSGPYHKEVGQFRLDKALDYVWLKIRNLNSYLEKVKPWELAKKQEEAEHLQEVLAYSAGSLVQIADLLWPFLPSTSEAIKHIFAGGKVATYDGVLFPKIYKHTPDPKNTQPNPAPATE